MTHDEFHKAVFLLARSINKTCIASNVDVLQIYHPETNADPIWSYSAYIEDYGYTPLCPSPEAALAKLQDAIDGKTRLILAPEAVQP